MIYLHSLNIFQIILLLDFVEFFLRNLVLFLITEYYYLIIQFFYFLFQIQYSPTNQILHPAQLADTTLFQSGVSSESLREFDILIQKSHFLYQVNRKKNLAFLYSLSNLKQDFYQFESKEFLLEINLN
ncbi:unnamed protein product [Paramecium pentaurelia]|uniref:Transmembrane protein n=1 Tax=Paramecium pentaurelia TaxID=43138 RepID=A0A8S1VW52_9CILI|nr:unnamed protein product [Paramecium pentaurelia]